MDLASKITLLLTGLLLALAGVTLLAGSIGNQRATRLFGRITSNYRASADSQMKELDALLKHAAAMQTAVLAQQNDVLRELYLLLDSEQGLNGHDITDDELTDRIAAIKTRANEMIRERNTRGDRTLLAPHDDMDLTAQCGPCDCRDTGWGGPHCHYHIAALQDMTGCPMTGKLLPR
jgi:hypothetical protein